MTEARADFAVLGATPQARLVAGLLASVHGKSVIFHGESQSSYRLQRGIDMSAAPITRPETWAILKEGLNESIKLISRIGKRAAWSRVDPIFFADAAAGKEALAHTRHMAAAFGHAAERVPVSLLGSGRDGLVLRDATILRRSVLEPALDRWLDAAGVHRPHTDAVVTIRPDGSAQFVMGDQGLEASQAILADDSAILAHLPVMQWPTLFKRQVASTILTEPTDSVAAPVMHQLDSGLVLTQQAERGIVAFGPGAVDEFAASLSVLLGSQRAFRQGGQSNYTRIMTTDGAPAVGRAAGSGPDILAGFSNIGAFMAPAVARWLCGVATPMESAWLGNRLVDRDPLTSRVADVGDQR